MNLTLISINTFAFVAVGSRFNYSCGANCGS